MTRRAVLRRTGKSAIRRIVFLLAAALILSGCGRNAQLFAVKAVAVGVPSLAPFFDEHSGLGRDTPVRSRRAPGGLQAGDTPGLYGGSRTPTVCDIARLKEFLTDPRNDRKAKVWAQVEGIAQREIPDYLDRLTPVLLRHDTLVRNHDFKKGRATPFDSLLQAGIAVLVDERGQPTVKCSCGNPLRPFRGDTTRISVTFAGGNEKWAGYDRTSVVAVHPAPRRLTRIALVDVHDPDRGLDRPVGTSGGHDSAFDTRVRHKVPDVTGLRFAEAGRRLAAEGLAVAYAGRGAPPDDAAVTGSDPGPGTELAFGQYVTLSADMGETDGPQVPGESGTSRKGAAGPTDSGTGRGRDGDGSASPSTGGPTEGKTGGTPATPSDSGRVSSPTASSGSSSPSMSRSSSRAHSSPTAQSSQSPTAAHSSRSPTAPSSSTARPPQSSPTAPSSSTARPPQSSPTAHSSPTARPPQSSPTAHPSPSAGGGSSPATASGSPTAPHDGPTSAAKGGTGAPRGSSAPPGRPTGTPVTDSPTTGTTWIRE
ncbi:DUF6777 domain-containing protein [Streptomyces sp. NPDC093261]|uniref:DUF6777 domain-containing protein n=1 Tax=Streptomyces sp. NPDC093261 TaxID=3366037 RepID=UPI0038198761